MNDKLVPVHREEKQLVTCQNCEEMYEEGAKFCPHCGQKTSDDLTIGVLFYNTISNYFSFDARFLKSFLPLMFRPGYLASRFIQGKRLMYLHPAQMYLFVSVIFFFIISFSTRDLVSKADEINQKVAESEIIDDLSTEAQQTVDSVAKSEVLKQMETNPALFGLDEEQKAQVDSIVNSKIDLKNANLDKIEMDRTLTDSGKVANVNVKGVSWDFNRKMVDSLIDIGAEDKDIYKAMGLTEDDGFLKRRLFKNMLSLYKGKGAGSIVQAFFDSIPLSMFFLLPIFALILKIFYFNKGKYAHHLVFSFYYFSFLFTVFAIVFAVNRFVYDVPDWLDWLVALSTFLYFLIALITFYKQNWFLTIIKSGIISFVFLLLVIPMAFVILIGFSFLFY